MKMPSLMASVPLWRSVTRCRCVWQIMHPQHTLFHAPEHHTLARASCRAFKCLQTLILALAALPPSIWSMYTTSAPRLPS